MNYKYKSDQTRWKKQKKKVGFQQNLVRVNAKKELKFKINSMSSFTQNFNPICALKLLTKMCYKFLKSIILDVFPEK